MKKILISLLLVVMLVLALAVPTMAEETPTGAVTFSENSTWTEVYEQITSFETQYIQLMANVTEDVTVDHNLYIDLNGFDITGTVTVTAGELRVFDSETADYDVGEDWDGYGKIYTIATEGDGAVARDFVTPAALTGKQHRYVTFYHQASDGLNSMVYSSHRIYLAVYSNLLMPMSAAVDFRVVFLCDQIVADNVDNFGVKVYLQYTDDEGSTKTSSNQYGPAMADEATYAQLEAYDSSKAWYENNSNIIRVINILQDGLNLDAQKLRAEDTYMNARAYIQLDGLYNEEINFTKKNTDADREVVSSLVKKSFQDVTEAAQDIADDPANEPLAENVQSALTDMYKTYKTLMTDWNVPIYCLCGASENGGEHDPNCKDGELVWERYTEDRLKAGGNYYLVKNLTDQTQITLTGTSAVAANLDLKGFNITAATGARVFSVQNNATLTLTNTDPGENKGMISSTGHSDGAGVVHMRAGDNAGDAPVLNMFSGVTLANTEVVADGGTATTPNGGVIKLDVGTLNMYGGTITGGKTTGHGGNVYIVSGATVVMYYEARIINGTSNAGGNGQGGNVYVAGELIVNGGEITGGASYSAANKDIFCAGGLLDMNGGETGYVAISSVENSRMQVSGAPVVTLVKLFGSSEISVTDALTEDASITIDTSSKTTVTLALPEGVTLTPAQQSSTASAFAGSDSSVGTMNSESTGITLANGTYYCLCGATKNGSATHKLGCTYETEGQLFWQPYSSSTITTSGNYYLTESLELSSQITWNNSSEALKVALDLNGFNITGGSNQKVFLVYGDETLILTNTGAVSTETEEHGVIKTGGNTAGVGLLQTTSSSGNGATIIMLDGVTLTNTDTAADTTNSTSGGVVGLYNGTFYMYGGTINGGYVTGDGGAVYNNKTFYMYGGTINGGTAANGGAIYNKGTVNISGGTINGSTATSGGAIYSSGTIQMTGGTINGSTATNGGAVYLNGGSMTMDGTGKAETAKPTITGGTTTAAGGAVYIASGGSLAVTHGTVKEGTTTGADAHGGNVSLKGTLTLNAGAKIIDGECTGTGQGGNVNVQSGGKLIVNDGEVTGGTCVTNATVCADIFSVKGTITMTGGKLGKVSSASDANVSTINVSGAAKIEQYNCSTATNVINITGALTAGADIRLKRNSGAAAATITATGLTSEQKTFAASCISGLGSTGYGNSTVGILQADGTTINLGAITHCLCGAAKTTAELNTVTHKAGCTYQTAGLLTWTRYDNSANLSNGKNYYLDANRTGSTATITVPEGAVVNIDLNGYTISRTGYSAITVTGGTLNLTNTSANPRHGTGGMVSSAHSVITMNAGETDAPSVTMLDGVTIKNTATTSTVVATQGGAVLMNAGTFTMNGGAIYGGTVTGNGAAVSMPSSSKSVFNMNGGDIYAGTVGSGTDYNNGGAFNMWGTLYINGGTIHGTGVTNKTGGGAIYVGNGGVVSMENGTINGGPANNGGAVFVASGGTFTFEGGTINGGNANTSGGAITNKGTLNIIGGTITNGQLKGDANADDSCVLVDSGTVNISGGTVAKLARKSSAVGTVNVSGSAKIQNYVSSATLTITGTLSGAQIHANFGADTVVAVAGTDVTLTDEMAMCFTGTGNTVGTVTADGIKLAEGAYHCICGASEVENGVHLNPGCNGDILFWQPYPNETFATSLAAGNYYLTQSLTGSGQLAITGTADAGKVINIDLNGWDITVTGGRVFQVNDYATLGLTNTKVNPDSNPNAGTLSTVSGNASTWTTVQMRNTGCMNVYPGVSLVSGATAASSQGSVIVLGSTSTVNMYGGKVSGAKVNVNWNGGTVEIEGGTMNVYSGALIEGSEAIIGGAVYVKSGTLNVKGGTIDGSKSTGVTTGGAVSVNSGATMEMTSGTINGATVTGNGGTINNAGTLTITGGTVYGGAAGSNGGTIHSSGTLTIGGTAEIKNGTSNGGYATYGASCIYINGASAVTNLTSGNVFKISCNATNHGTVNVSGNPTVAYIKPNSVINITGTLSGAEIHVDATEGAVVAQAGTDSEGNTVVLTNEMAGCFFGSGDTVGMLNAEGNVELAVGYCMCGASKTEGAECALGCDGKIYAWTPYTADCTKVSGNYYLTEDVVDAGQMVFGVPNDTTEKTVRLDLNGHSITRSSGRATQVWDCTTVWLCNTGTADETHGLISSGGVGISNGVIDSSNSDNHSAAMQMTKATVTVNMLEGVTLKNNAAEGLVMNRAGAINVVGTFNMFGGTIIGGNVANQGGAVNIQSGSTFNMHAGSITGGNAGATGGAIYNAGTLNISGGSITGGTATNGGNTVYNSATLKLSGNVTIDDITTLKQLSVTGELTGAVGVTLPAGYGRITDATCTANNGVFTVTGKEVLADSDGLYVRYRDTANTMYVAHAQASLAPTAEQFTMAENGYLDADGYNALPISGYGRYQAATGMSSENPLQADILVVTDDQGDTVVLITADVGSVANGTANTLRRGIANAYGIPVDNIVISANHIHSAPKWVNQTTFYNVGVDGKPITDSDAEGYATYTLSESYFTTVSERIIAAVGEALNNRAKVTQVIRYTVADANAANTAGMIFHEVRNYEALNANGEKIGMYTNNHQTYSSSVTPSSWIPEAAVDSSLQIAGYVTEDDEGAVKRIMIANFQTHPIVNGLGSEDDHEVHADMIGYFRQTAETAHSCEVMYFSGASGNVDPKANKGDNSSKNYTSSQAYGNALAALLPATFTSETSFATDVKAASTTLTGNIQADGAFGAYDLTARLEIVDQIRAEVAAGDYDAGGFMPDNLTSSNENAKTRAEKHAIYAMEYGIYSTYHANHMYTRQANRESGTTTKTMTLGAYRIGDLAFISAPYEMYCENGQQVKDSSNAAMTMVATLANGSFGYIPSAEGYENGGYSTDSSWFEAGTGEAAVEKFNELLGELYPAN